MKRQIVNKIISASILVSTLVLIPRNALGFNFTSNGSNGSNSSNASNSSNSSNASNTSNSYAENVFIINYSSNTLVTTSNGSNGSNSSNTAKNFLPGEEYQDIDNSLRANLLEFKIEIEGKEYKLPFNYAEFNSHGWNISANEDGKMLSPKEYTMSSKLMKDEKVIFAQIANMKSDKEISVKESYIASLGINLKDKKEAVSFKLSKGINENSVAKEIIEAYGQPNVVEISDTSIFYRYALDEFSFVDFYFERNSQSLTSITIQNFVTP